VNIQNIDTVLKSFGYSNNTISSEYRQTVRSPYCIAETQEIKSEMFSKLLYNYITNLLRASRT